MSGGAEEPGSTNNEEIIEEQIVHLSLFQQLLLKIWNENLVFKLFDLYMLISYTFQTE